MMMRARRFLHTDEIMAGIIVIGGSTAFGYGLRWNESFPYYLEQKLKVREPRTPVSVVNLGIPTDSARTFVAWNRQIRDIRKLRVVPK